MTMRDEAAAAALAALARVIGTEGVSHQAVSVAPLPGLTNASFRVDTPTARFAVQLPLHASQVDAMRGHAIAATRLAHDLGIGAAFVGAEDHGGAIVTRWVDAAEPATAARLRERPGGIAALAALFARLHGSTVRLARRFDPFAAIAALVAQGASADGPPASVAVALARAAAELAAGSPASVPIHGDPVPGNVLAAPDGLILIDWEFAGMGDPAWDIAYFSLEAGLSPAEEDALAAAHGAPELDARRRQLNRMTAAALAALWGRARMRTHAAPDLSGWIAMRRQESMRLATRLYGDGDEG